MPKVYLTTKEVADYLKITPCTLEGMRMNGSGPPYYKVGPFRKSAVRYSQEDVDAWLQENHINSTSDIRKKRNCA